MPRFTDPAPPTLAEQHLREILDRERVLDLRAGLAHDFRDEDLELADVPGDLVEAVVLGRTPAICEWGHCSRPAIGWAMCEDKDCPCPIGWHARVEP